MMTKKDFIALADVVRGIQRPGSYARHAQWLLTVDVLVDFCQSQNPRFDRQRWLDYIAGRCGPNGGKL